jgi:hypothetical protein
MASTFQALAMTELEKGILKCRGEEQRLSLYFLSKIPCDFSYSLSVDNGLGWAEVFFNTNHAIRAFLRVDVRLPISFDDSHFGAFINTATAINTIFGNDVSDNSLLLFIPKQILN